MILEEDGIEFFHPIERSEQTLYLRAFKKTPIFLDRLGGLGSGSAHGKNEP